MLGSVHALLADIQEAAEYLTANPTQVRPPAFVSDALHPEPRWDNVFIPVCIGLAGVQGRCCDNVRHLQDAAC